MPGTVRMWLLFAVACLAGCAPPNVALFSSGADPGFRFPDPGQVQVAVAPMRDNKIGMGLEPTLDEKILVDDVEMGLNEAGFRVVRLGGDRAPDFIMFCEAEINVEQYDTYERIPTFDTVVGTYHTRRGYRTYYETVHSSVVVPATRRYTYSVLRLALVEAEVALDPAANDKPIDNAAVWYATVEANGPLIMRERSWQAYQAMELWARTGQKRMNYPPSRH